MAVSAADVKKLRNETGAGMMDCKKALEESEGDYEGAIEYLRKKGQKVAAKRADRETSEGNVFARTNADNTEAVLIAFSCETDFVAKNEEFQQMGQKIAEKAAQEKPETLEALMQLELEGKTIEEQLTEMIGKIGEKLTIKNYAIVSGEQVEAYVHNNGKLGVLLALEGVNGQDVSAIARDLTMQIAAMNPVAIDKDGVPQEVIEREMEIGREQARAEGKPDNIVDKIATGKLNKFYKEATLLNQEFVKDNKKTVQDVLKETGKELTVKEFKRVFIG